MRFCVKSRAHLAYGLSKRKRFLTGFVLLALAFLASLSIVRDFHDRKTSFLVARMTKEMSRWEDRSQIDLPGCKLSFVDPHNAVVWSDWFQEGTVLDCSHQKRNIFYATLRGNRTCPELDAGVLWDDYRAEPHQVNCKYRTVRHDPAEIVVMNSIKYGEEIPLVDCPDEDLIWISCYVRGSYYKQVLFTVKDVPETTRRTTRGPSNALTAHGPFNVLVLGVDSVSRLNFHRNFPETLRTIRSIYGEGAIELQAFNKVGANSAPNQFPFLTGKRFRHETDLAKGEYADNFSRYIWEDFSAAGFATLFAEEQMHYGLFVYPGRKGLKKIPTDFWPRPPMLVQSKATSFFSFSHETCDGGEPTSASLLRYWLHAEQVSRRSLFSYVWLSQLTHDSLTGGKSLDPLISQFFRSMSDRTKSETIILFLSDHGYRMAPYRETPLGMLEDMLPFGWFLLPPKFRKQYPDEVDRLEANAFRLVTPYDIHATLLSLAALASNGSQTLAKENSTVGVSLLERVIPPERTCGDAGVDAQYCSCYTSSDIDTDKPQAKLIAEYVIKTINDLLKRSNATLCSRLYNPVVVRFERVGDNLNNVRESFLKIAIEAEPGKIKLEAFLKRGEGSQFAMQGLPERVDRYGPTSRCAENTAHEKFCRCKVV